MTSFCCCGMDETRAHDARGYDSRTFTYTPNPLEGGFRGREFELTLTQKKKGYQF